LHSIENKKKKNNNLLRMSDLDHNIDCREQASKEEDYSKSESDENSQMKLLRDNPLMKSNNLAKLITRRSKGNFKTLKSRDTETTFESKRKIISHNDIYNQFYTPRVCYERARSNKMGTRLPKQSTLNNLNWVDNVKPKLKGSLISLKEKFEKCSRIFWNE
jgi:hypothetical protein